MKRYKTCTAMLVLGALLALATPLQRAVGFYPPPPPKPEKELIEYYGLGDSIAAGHGLADDLQLCKRSTYSYPWKVDQWLRSNYRVAFTHLACTGAVAHIDHLGSKPVQKWLTYQVNRVIGERQRLRSTRRALVSFTIGANDFEFADLSYTALRLCSGWSTRQFESHARARVEKIRSVVWQQITNLLNDPNVNVIWTQQYQPFNPVPSWLGLLSPPFACDPFEAYRRAEYAIHSINDMQVDLLVSLRNCCLEMARRFQIAVLHPKFHGHESARGAPLCGQGSPNEPNTWIQYPLRGYTTTSDWTMMIGGDCFHPNYEGARQIFTEVKADAQRLGF